MKKIIHGLVYCVFLSCSVLWVSSKPSIRSGSCAELVLSVQNSNDLKIRISVKDRIINNSIESIDETAQKQWSNLTENSTVHSLEVQNGCLLRICWLTNEPIRRQKCDNAIKTFVVPIIGNLEDKEEDFYGWDKKVSSILSVDCSCKTPKRTGTIVPTDSGETIPAECPTRIEGNRCTLIKPNEDECARLYQERDCTSCRFSYVSLPAERSNSRYQITGKSMISSIALNDKCSLTADGYSILDETRRIELLFNNNTPGRLSNINEEVYGINNFTCQCKSLPSYFDPPTENPKQSSDNFTIFISVTAILLVTLAVITARYFYRFGCGVWSPLKDTAMIDDDDTRRQDAIKSGRFGIVYKGSLKLKEKPRKWIPVAMKYVKSHTNSIYTQSIISEIKIMSRLGSHDNLVHFYGWCSNSVDANDIGDMCIIMELCLSSLKQYLEENRLSFRDTLQTIPGHYVSFGVQNANGNNLTSSNLIKWCLEIATGMEYINSQNIAHFDLAVRNVLLANDLTAKIADYGLSQNLLESGYIQNAAIPVPALYMAPESLLHDTVSNKTDVWSYGVCVWEIFSLGNEPTLEGVVLGDENVRQIIAQQYEDGVRLPELDYATSETNQKLLECWNMLPELRPDFTNLKEFFTNQMETLKQVHVPDSPVEFNLMQFQLE